MCVNSNDGNSNRHIVDLFSGTETIYILVYRRSYPVASHIAYALGKFGVHS